MKDKGVLLERLKAEIIPFNLFTDNAAAGIVLQLLLSFPIFYF